MTVEEAGRKGGEATSRNHDRDFYEEIGRKGGEARSKQRSNNTNQNRRTNNNN
ncbi:general stress protein B [Lysinibacillus sphaericus C3-41]|nr:general stress protein B [Lysinibacillus sphaericus C3-41]